MVSRPEQGAFVGKTALVTGGASGIGRACIQELVRGGAQVVIADINDALGKAMANEIGEDAMYCRLDVSSNEAWTRAIEAATSWFGGLNILVNCAGMAIAGSIETATLEDWQRTLDVNATGTFLGCQNAVRTMRNHGGAIVNIASARAHRVSRNQLAYSCSKAMVVRMTEGIALHCAEEKLPIRCNAVCPGVIDTPILGDTVQRFGGGTAGVEALVRLNPIGRLGTAEEIANAVCFLASERASFITGAALDVDGAFRIRD